MTEKIDGIILDLVKHSDRHNVAIVYTRSRGRMACLVPVGKTAKSRSRLSALMLLARVAGEVKVKAGQEIYYLSGITSPQVWHNIYFNPVKSSLIFFLAEFLNRFLRQSPPDEKLWDFIVTSLNFLDECPSASVGNFHLAFLIGLLHLSGIMPPVEEYEPGMVFDMQKGEFFFQDLFSQGLTPSGNSFRQLTTGRLVLNAEESSFLPALYRINYRNMTKFRFTTTQRSSLLNRIIQYFSIHLSISANFKSLEILHEILS